MQGGPLSSSQAPLTELVVITGDGATGEFICVTPSVEIHVYLQAGRVAWATTSTHPLEFSRHIKAHTEVDDESFYEIVEHCRRERLPLGETLVSWGLVRWEDVKAALRHQVGLSLAALTEVEAARTVFLVRPRFREYDPELTLDLQEILADPAEAPAAPEPALAAPMPAREEGGLASRLLLAIDGAAWVELLEADALVEAAPPGDPTPRVHAALPRRTVMDGADFVALRSARATLLGARLPRGRRSLWCMLTAESTFGAAVATLCSFGAGPGARLVGAGPEAGSPAPSWELGDLIGPVLQEIRLVLERVREVLAVVVLSNKGQPVLGVGRGGLETRTCLDLVQRRAAVLAAPLSAHDSGEPRPDAPGVGTRSIVTGEPALWCFGAEIVAEKPWTMWVLTERGASQGLGWACLTALGRGLTRALRVSETR